MESGLLWFDDNPKISFASKVEKAASRYRERFGRAPNVCYVHPRTLAAASSMPTSIQVVTLSTVRPDHFWVGVRSS